MTRIHILRGTFLLALVTILLAGMMQLTAVPAEAGSVNCNSYRPPGCAASVTCDGDTCCCVFDGPSCQYPFIGPCWEV